MSDQLAHLRDAFGFAGITRRAAEKAWDESRVNRWPAGDPRGGQFAPKDGAEAGAGQVIDATGPDFVAPFLQFAEQDNAGKPVYFLCSRGVTDEAREKALTAFFDVPEYARAGVANVVLHEEKGYKFEAGGKQFEAGGNYDVRGSGGVTINIFDANSYSDAGMKRIIDHECGHNLEQPMILAAAEQDHESWNKSPELFDFQGNITDQEKFQRLYPAADARIKYLDARRQGAVGLTPYARAWNTDSEIIAEAHKIYRSGDLSGLKYERALRHNQLVGVAISIGKDLPTPVAAATWNAAEALSDWFEAVEDRYERQRKAQ